jgi:hypothetical protein
VAAQESSADDRMKRRRNYNKSAQVSVLLSTNCSTLMQMNGSRQALPEFSLILGRPQVTNKT